MVQSTQSCRIPQYAEVLLKGSLYITQAWTRAQASPTTLGSFCSSQTLNPLQQVLFCYFYSGKGLNTFSTSDRVSERLWDFSVIPRSVVELSTSDWCRKLRLTFQIQSPITQQARPFQTNSHFSLSPFISLHTNGTHQAWLAWTGSVLTSHVRAVNGGFGRARGEACPWADVRPASREMARSDESCRGTCSAEAGTRTGLHMRGGMCCFSNRWQRSGDGREKTKDGERGDRTWSFPSLLSPDWTQTLFLSLWRWWFHTVWPSSLEFCCC